MCGDYFMIMKIDCVIGSVFMAFAFEESHKQATHDHCFCYTMIYCGLGFSDLMLFMLQG